MQGMYVEGRPANKMCPCKCHDYGHIRCGDCCDGVLSDLKNITQKINSRK